MAALVFAMNVSLDGFVDHVRFTTSPALFRHWTEYMRELTGALYGRRMYEIMRVWDTADPAWSKEERAFAAAWRRLPKWVASRTLDGVGYNATLVRGNLETLARDLKARHDGVIAVSGPHLARSLAHTGLIDQYRLYYHPLAFGSGTPFFAGAPPRLTLVSSDLIGEDVVRLTYAPPAVSATVGA